MVTPRPHGGAGTYRVVRDLPSAVARVLGGSGAATRAPEVRGGATGPLPEPSAAVVMDATPPELLTNDRGPSDSVRAALERVDGARVGGIERRHL